MIGAIKGELRFRGARRVPLLIMEHEHGRDGGNGHSECCSLVDDDTGNPAS